MLHRSITSKQLSINQHGKFSDCVQQNRRITYLTGQCPKHFEDFVVRIRVKN